MINPSASGWIVKFLVENQPHFIDFHGDHLAFYESCRKTGFIYGYVVDFQLTKTIGYLVLKKYRLPLSNIEQEK